MGNYSEGSLTGLRVLDMAQGGTQICGKIMADMGADVIKIEPPGGDRTGRIAPFFKDIPDLQKSLFWFAYNTNKRSITLNIESIDGQQILKKLIKNVDFLIESFQPGYLDNLGLGYQALSQINPKLIVTSISFFGQTGPKARFKGCELVAWASSGALYVTGEPDRPPVWISFPQTLLHTGVEACIGTLIAHWERTTSGKGQHVDVSIQDTFNWSTDQAHTQAYELTGESFHRIGSKFGPTRSQLFACKDGFVAFLPTGGLFANTQGLVKWMVEEGMAPSWLADYDWVKGYDASKLTKEESERIEAEFTRFFMTKTKKELFDQAIPRNIQIAPVYTSEDICESEHLKSRNFWVEVEHDELDCTLTYPKLFSNSFSLATSQTRRAPLIGEHNMEIYRQELDLSFEKIIALKESGVI